MSVCLSVCQQNPELSELVGMVQKGLGRSERVWKGLEGSREGPGRVPGGSQVSSEFVKSRPSRH